MATTNKLTGNKLYFDEYSSTMSITSPASLSFDILEKSLAALKSINIANYFRSRTKMVDFYEGSQGGDYGDDPQYLKDFGFSDMKMPLQTLNITKKIIDKTSLLYKYAPDRILYDAKDKEMEDDPYNEFINDNPWFNEWRKQVERYKKLLGVVVSMPLYTESGWKPYVFTSYIPHFLENDPFVPVAYSLPLAADLNNTSGQKQKWLLVSDKYFFLHDESGKGIEPYFDDYTNPLGIMPVIEERLQWPIITQYWPEGANDLVNTNQAVNVMLNDIQAMIHYQAFDEVIAVGARQDDIGGIKRGPNRIIATGAPENDMHTLSKNPLITESMQSVRDMIENIAWGYNLNVNWSQDGSPQSGFSLLVKNMELMESRQNDEINAQMAEQKVYDVIRVQGERFVGLDLKLPEAKVFCNFDDSMRLPVNEKEQIEIWQSKIDANVKSYIDWIQSEEGVDEKTAEEIYRRNKEINATFTRGQQALRDVLNQVNNEPANNTEE